MLRIGLTGAGGTGKGTIGNALSKIFNMTFLPSHIKETGCCLGFSESYKQKVSMERQYAFQHSILFGQIYQERALCLAEQSFIAERTTLDYIPYFLARDFGSFDKFDRDFYVDTARSWASQNYDLIFYLPVEFDPADKETNSWKERDTDDRVRTNLKIVEELVYSIHTKVVHLSGSNDKRIKTASNEIADFVCYHKL